MTKMGSIIGHRIDCNGVGALRGQRHIPTKYQPNLLARARLISTYYLARLTKTAMLRRLVCISVLCALRIQKAARVVVLKPSTQNRVNCESETTS